MVRFELEKNLKHLEILIKQNHTEVEALELNTSGDTPAVYIYYDKKKIEFSKLFFNLDDDPINLYRRILDDIADKAFVRHYCETDAASLYQVASVYKDTDSDYIRK